jgi:hypothetical protein
MVVTHSMMAMAKMEEMVHCGRMIVFLGRMCLR